MDGESDPNTKNGALSNNVTSSHRLGDAIENSNNHNSNIRSGSEQEENEDKDNESIANSDFGTIATKATNWTMNTIKKNEIDALFDGLIQEDQNINCLDLEESGGDGVKSGDGKDDIDNIDDNSTAMSSFLPIIPSPVPSRVPEAIPSQENQINDNPDNYSSQSNNRNRNEQDHTPREVYIDSSLETSSNHYNPKNYLTNDDQKVNYDYNITDNNPITSLPPSQQHTIQYHGINTATGFTRQRRSHNPHQSKQNNENDMQYLFKYYNADIAPQSAPSLQSKHNSYNFSSSIPPSSGRGGMSTSSDGSDSTNGVSSILESMGLVPSSRQKKEKKQKRHGVLHDFLQKQKIGLHGDYNNDGEGKMEKFNKIRQERMVHIRASTTMIFLVTFMYFFVQLNSIARQDKDMLKNIRGKKGVIYGLAIKDEKDKYRMNAGATLDTSRRRKSLQLHGLGGSHYDNGDGGFHEEGVDRPYSFDSEFAVPRKNVERKAGGSGAGNIQNKVSSNAVEKKVPSNSLSINQVKDIHEKIYKDIQNNGDDVFNSFAKEETISKPVLENVQVVDEELHDDYGGNFNGISPKVEQRNVVEEIHEEDKLTTGVATSVGEHSSTIEGENSQAIVSETGIADSTETGIADKPETSIGDVVPANPISTPIITISEKEENNEESESTLPILYESLSDTSIPDPQHRDLAFFWNIPRSGGSSIRDVMTLCQRAVLASEAGTTFMEADNLRELKVVTVFDHKFVNVDVSYPLGIERAKRLGLVESGLADVVVTPQFYAALSLFGGQPVEGGRDGVSMLGRAFTLLRHPVERAVSTFHSLKEEGVGGGGLHDEVRTMTIEDYARSRFVENNWMVRFLTGKMEGEITAEHLDLAKEVLRRKMIIGLLEKKEESLARFEHHFGFGYNDTDPTEQYKCREAVINGDDLHIRSSENVVQQGTLAWGLLEWQNRFDLQLYEYGKVLFGQQGEDLFQDLKTDAVDAPEPVLQ